MAEDNILEKDVKKHSIWLKWDKQFLQAARPNFNTANEQAIAKISDAITQNQAKIVQDALNHAFHQLDRTTILQQLADGITDAVSHVDVAGYRQLSSGIAQIGNGLTLKSVEGNAYMSALIAYRYNQTHENAGAFKNKSILAQKVFQELMSGTKSPQDAMHLANVELGKVNKLQGDILEQYFSLLKTTVNAAIKQKIQVTDQNLVNLLNSNIQGFVPQSVEGDKATEITVSIDGNDIKVIGGAQDKVDVSLKLPFLEDDLKNVSLNMSLKNQARFNDVHLLSEGSVVNLISQSFSAMHSGGKWLYNAFIIPDYHGLGGMLNELHKIFLIKAMTGQHMAGATNGIGETAANLMVVYIGDRVNPFRVISTTSILTSFMDMSGDQLAKYAKFEYQPQEPPINAGIPRTEASFDAVNNLKLSVTLAKEAIKLSYLKQLQS